MNQHTFFSFDLYEEKKLLLLLLRHSTLIHTQRWGNSKGQVYIGYPGLDGVVGWWCPPALAPKKLTEQRWEIKRETEGASKLISALNAVEQRLDRHLQFNRYIGGGGGHELHVDRFQVIVHVDDKRKAMHALADSKDWMRV